MASEGSTKGPMYPTMTDLVNSFSHLYLTFVGSIKIHGEREATVDEIYMMLTADEKNKHWSAIEKDVIEILLWAATMPDQPVLHTHGEYSKFFGPDAVMREVIPPKQLFILSKRSSFPTKLADVNLVSESQWTLAGKDWMVEVNLHGHVQKLSAEKVKEVSDAHRSFYIKTDKYSPYNLMSSYSPSANSSSSIA